MTANQKKNVPQLAREIGMPAIVITESDPNKMKRIYRQLSTGIAHEVLQIPAHQILSIPTIVERLKNTYLLSNRDLLWLNIVMEEQLTYQEIANKYRYSHGTVKVYLSTIYRKLGVQGRGGVQELLQELHSNTEP